MTPRDIFNMLTGVGMTDEGACGLMGNMQAESGMIPNIAQRGMTAMSDEAYTAAADNGGIDFAQDAVGYGLCQWTYHTRKAKLLAYAKSCGLSVGDPLMQVRFCIRELQSEYPMLFLKLCTSHDIDECADRVCDQYERPAINNYPERRRFARSCYSDFRGSGALAAEHQAQAPQAETTVQDACKLFPPDESVSAIQMVMNYNGYWGKPDGYKTEEFFDALDVFVKDMKRG